jgi:hypothetical protein
LQPHAREVGELLSPVYDLAALRRLNLDRGSSLSPSSMKVTVMDVIEAIFVRRSVGQFTTHPVAHDMIEAVIAATIQARSAVNEQPWIFDAARPHIRRLESPDAPTWSCDRLAAASDA